MSQNPAAGAQVDPESSVALVLSTGPCAAEGEGEGENTPPTEAQLRELLTAAFDTVDVDNDGQVSFAEALTALAGLTQEVFNSVDTDGNGQISRAEAGLNEGGCAGCRGGKADFMPDRMKKLFSGAFLGMLSLIAMVSFERRRR